MRERALTKRQQRLWEEAKVHPVRITSSKDNTATGEIRIRFWTEGERYRRAFKALGVCWFLAVACIAVPIAHFILVPSFFLAGPFIAMAVFGRLELVLGGCGECPDCQTPLTIVSMSRKAGMRMLCPKCYAQVEIETV